MKVDFRNKLIPELLRDTAQRSPNSRALMVNRGDGSLMTITYGEFWEKAMKLGSYIQRKGFKMGDHIAVLGNNSPEWAIAYFGIHAAGCIVVPLDSAQKPQELRHIVRHSDAKAIILGHKFLPIIEDDNENQLDNLLYYELEKIDKLISSEKSPLDVRFPDSDEATAVIIYTSGTTGSPKGVMLSHRNIVSDVSGSLPLIQISENDTFISVLPIHHAFEATGGFMIPVSVGAGICYARALRGKEILEDIQASGATIILGVPLLFDKIYNGIKKGVKKKGAIAKTIFDSTMGLSGFLNRTMDVHSGKVLMKTFRKKAGFGDLWLMVSGGAAIRSEVVEFFNRFGVHCLQGYGLSETSPILAVNPIEKSKNESVGPPIFGVNIRIDNPNSIGIGEIQATGDPVFSQYYKNPEATREVFTVDNWFKTGDLGKLDNEGYLYIMGRAKNLIVTAGGKNVYPEEIEEKLNNSNYILESLVTGISNEGKEEPFAIIVPDFDYIDSKYGGDLDENELEKMIKSVVENVNKNIASYKRLKGFKIQREEFPKTSTRKIKRYLYQGKEIKL